MFHTSLKALAIISCAAVVVACGGGSDDPDPTPVSATLAISNSTNALFNGVYTTTTVSLAEVVKVNPIGSEPEVCSFRFSGLRGPGGEMTGDVRYIPGTTSLHVIFIAINSVEFVSRDTSNAAVDKPNNEVDLSGKTLAASTGVASTLTVTGSIPMRGSRPEGC
ncbi:MAG TPA: hypothetical protein VLJ86_12885 [Ramlibacter sp.]|nr:hypothetical protein [Ramlibacter sp.]